MNRRQLISMAVSLPIAAAASVTQTPAADPQWVTVAHRGWNMNQREYTEEALAQMAAGLPGAMILAKELPEGDSCIVAECRLHDVRGVVTSSRYEHGQVQVCIRWFSAACPLRDGFLTPSGLGHKYERLENGYMRVLEYEPTHLTFSTDPAFQGATRI